jgi:predicted metal-binding protein
MVEKNRIKDYRDILLIKALTRHVKHDGYYSEGEILAWLKEEAERFKKQVAGQLLNLEEER